MKTPFFSIIMPTYNSEETIETALKSIAIQSCRDEVEILVIDGGSTDRTIEIARQYGARILHNPDRLPEYAKRIGLLEARGRWLVKQDSDEEWTEPRQLEERRDFLLDYPQIQVYVPEIEYPEKGRGISSMYAGICGDPFSWFIYRYSVSFLGSYRAHIVKTEPEKNRFLLCFEETDIMPIADGGTSMISLEYLRTHFDGCVLESLTFASSMSYEVLLKNGNVGCIKGDTILHHNDGDFKRYLSKLRFRIINNLSAKKEAGYAIREAKTEALKKRKVLFGLYVLSIFGPIVDSFLLSLKNRDKTFMLHFFYTYYLIIYALYYCVKRSVKGEDFELSYGK